ncbi:MULTISPECIES: ABC transporter ATP-binding protein [Listeria]|uniref:ATP-binding cassette domain-containing protein n=1 Tax=Listeria TaxID=1637 RepID=UPI000B59040C|nr:MULTISPECIES: ABC transporter ATP-binding protein [Listeria]
MIQVQNLDIVTRETLLKDSNFTFKDALIYGISAPNGSGKTTLLRVLAGLKPANRGQIIFKENQLFLKSKDVRQKLFYYETSEWFNPNLSAWDYLQFVQKMWTSTSADLAEIIQFWELEEFLKIPIRKYSLGMKQKTLLAMYAVSQTTYWLLDEPTNGLDYKNQERFVTFIEQAKASGKTIIFTSHQDDKMYAISDEIVQIHDRKLQTTIEI